MKASINKLVGIAILLIANTFAQVDINADIASRAVWRGLAAGDAPVVQPSIEYTTNNITVGTWASYSISRLDSAQTENDFYIGTTIGNVDITVTDYYYPSGTYLFDRDTHTFELMLNYSYFVDLTLATNIYNDDNYSTYVQIAKGIDGLTLFVGGVVSESDWYGTKEPAIIEVGASATKGDFSVSYVLNPNEKKNYITLIYSL